MHNALQHMMLSRFLDMIGNYLLFMLDAHAQRMQKE